ncbi:MAG TPA: FtsQ-type POTRA domain-containing protein [Rhodoblastus sp.]|nr:FtsQ-type POTRA domain-containing protein [Rhodoblastus sp.]
MDGGRRVLQSLTELIGSPFAFAFARPQLAVGAVARPVPRPRVRAPRRTGLERLLAAAVHPLATGALVFGFLGGAFAYAAVRGGAYENFIQTVGTPGDLLARALGMGVDTVTISGISELSEKEILTYAGVKARNSLPYLDAEGMRTRLRSMPMVRDAEVRKLYPSRLAITIVERQPYALWQKDGQISIVSADGVPIDTLHDERYATLPLIVGDGANERLEQYRGIVEAAGDLGGRIKAGALVSRRRWSLFTTDGVEVRLPELEPEASVRQLAQMQRDYRILDKDIVALDLRVPGRVEVQLSNEAASARLDGLTRKARGKS